jgi:hypothetical protein
VGVVDEAIAVVGASSADNDSSAAVVDEIVVVVVVVVAVVAAVTAFHCAVQHFGNDTVVDDEIDYYQVNVHFPPYPSIRIHPQYHLY